METSGYADNRRQSKKNGAATGCPIRTKISGYENYFLLPFDFFFFPRFASR